MTKSRINITIHSTEQYLLLFKALFGLTPSEILVLAKFIDIGRELRRNRVAANPFTTEMRKRVAKELELRYESMGTYIKSLKDKGAIIESIGGYEIAEQLRERPKQVIFNIEYEESQEEEDSK